MRNIIILGAILGVLFPIQTYANQVPELSLSKKAQQSDAVIVGKIEAVKDVANTSIGTQYAIVRVRGVLKGAVGEKIKVWIKGPIAEMNPDCCIVGNDYVLFLESTVDKNFSPTDGGYGVVPLKP